MPACPMARPSQTPMDGNSIGVPPAASTPSFTARATRSRWIWPGMSSFQALATPTQGAAISLSV